MTPKTPNQVGSIVRRLGNQKSLEELIKSGHLKWNGAKVVWTTASVDAMVVFNRLPDDGTTRVTRPSSAKPS